MIYEYTPIYHLSTRVPSLNIWAPKPLDFMCSLHDFGWKETETQSPRVISSRSIRKSNISHIYMYV